MAPLSSAPGMTEASGCRCNQSSRSDRVEESNSATLNYRTCSTAIARQRDCVASFNAPKRRCNRSDTISALPFLIPCHSIDVTYSIIRSNSHTLILSSNSVPGSSGRHNTRSKTQKSPMTTGLLNPRSYDFLANVNFRGALSGSPPRVSSATKCACMKPQTDSRSVPSPPVVRVNQAAEAPNFRMAPQFPAIRIDIQ
jgi:hypothetical protein